MRLAHPGALHDPPLSENMATSVDSGQRYEHVERLEPQGPPNNVEAAQERLEPPAPRRTTRPSSSGRPRPVSMPPVAATEPINGPLASDQPEQRSQPHSSSRRGTSRATVRVIGNYSLGKTLGAGSMGKVKLAYHNQTGEKLAIKIVPRPSGSHSNTGNPTASFLARQAAKDASKEIRTVREAALSMILFHPYICGTREIIAQSNYHYIVFEFVNGGQMLDYIISHGRLRERVARKFARQIGSALEYCHKNNVVHRDLKIENILISESGNIKIIDFGLSNLYNPAAHLQTFCGSLYFAAPELLNAKAYTGPEVDIWSFGVVLYVLVCGKVPFDDQHMPALHAKIKRGIVDYPNWLSAECKHILSRMLVVVPSQRAPLSEVLNHPWMLRGFSDPPDPHLLHREPIRASELDPLVVEGMTGFEFGTPAEIERKLRDVLESETYRRMVEIWEKKRNPSVNGYRTNGESPSSSLTAINHLNSSPSPVEPTGSTRKGSKRFSGLGFDFYRRKFFNQGNSPPGTPTGKSPVSGFYGPQTTAIMDPHRATEYVDPCFGFHPLISIYFLVREKIDRERVYGPHFASSQISLNPPQPQPSSARPEEPIAFNVPGSQAAPPSAFKNGTTTAPSKPTPIAVAPPSAAMTKPNYDMPLPKIPAAPEAAHQPGGSYDSPVPKSPAAAAHQQPQPRTLAADLPMEVQRPREEGTSSPPSAFTGMPAAPKPAEKHQHRRSTSLTNRGAALMAGWGRDKVPRTAGPEQTSFDERVEDPPRRSEQVPRERDDGRVSPAATAPPASSHSGKEKEGAGSSIRRITTMLGNRLSEDNKKTLGRRGSLLRGAFLPRHSVDVAGRDGDERTQRGATRPRSQEDVMSDSEQARTMTDVEQTRSAPFSASHSQPASNMHRRAQTIVDSQSRESKHIRRGSLGAGFALATIGRRPKTAASSAAPTEGKVQEEDEARTVHAEEEEEGVLVNGDETRAGAAADDEGSATERDVKPLYLKGLFSVATTTTRPANVIKKDIRNVLDRMQINYREVKGGFECIHAPSIDLASIVTEAKAGTSRQGSQPNSQEASAASTIRRGIVRKTSKLSFATVRKREKTKESEQGSVTPTTITPGHSVPPSAVIKSDNKELPTRPSVSNASHPPVTTSSKLVSPSGGSSSFFNVPSPSAQSEANAEGPDPAKESIDKGATPSIRTQQTEGDPNAPDQEHEDLPDDLDKAIVAGNVPEDPLRQAQPGSSTTPTRDKFLPPIPKDFNEPPVSPTAKTTQTTAVPQINVNELFEASNSSALIVRFEIMIVKVPLLPLYGIQFRRIQGDVWQYHMLARRVLTELKL